MDVHEMSSQQMEDDKNGLSSLPESGLNQSERPGGEAQSETRPETTFEAHGDTTQPGAPSDAASDGWEADDEPRADFSSSAIPQDELERLTHDIIGALKSVYDPEIPADIYELGLIYKVDINDDRDVAVEMTLTAPGCPVAGEMPIWVEDAVSAVPGVRSTSVNLTFEPPWGIERMSDEAKVALNWY